MMRYLLRPLLFVVILSTWACNAKVYHVAKVVDYTVRVDERQFTTDKKVDDMVAPYRAKLESTMNRVIGDNESELSKGKPSSTLTNFMADAIRFGAADSLKRNIDMAFQNYGGVRINSLGPGPITVGEMYELMPFDNTLVLLEVGGDKLGPFFDFIAKSGGWPVSEGVSFSIQDSTIATNILINGEPLDINKNYILALPDYVANGGDNVASFTNCNREDTGILIRDLLILYVSNKKNIVPNNAKRILHETR